MANICIYKGTHKHSMYTHRHIPAYQQLYCPLKYINYSLYIYDKLERLANVYTSLRATRKTAAFVNTCLYMYVNNAYIYVFQEQKQIQVLQ